DPNCLDVVRQLQPFLAQLIEIGFSPNCAQQICDVSYSTKGSRFTLGDDEFEVPLVGEFNVRNAAMAISAARFYGVSLPKIRKALASFKGIARRQEVRGEARGRSEEHTSELQSPYELVCRLLPEKKKR